VFDALRSFPHSVSPGMHCGLIQRITQLCAGSKPSPRRRLGLNFHRMATRGRTFGNHLVSRQGVNSATPPSDRDCPSRQGGVSRRATGPIKVAEILKKHLNCTVVWSVAEPGSLVSLGKILTINFHVTKYISSHKFTCDIIHCSKPSLITK
jgi:hypothetical protein